MGIAWHIFIKKDIFLKKLLQNSFCCGIIHNVVDVTAKNEYRGIVQSVEHQSPKLGVVGSSPSAPAKKKAIRVSKWLFSVKFALRASEIASL